MRRGQQAHNGRAAQKVRRIGAVLFAVLIAVSLVTQYYRPAEAGVTSWPGNANVTAISAGSEHTCAIAGGKAYCWGYNASGQLGNGSTTSSSTPVAVSQGDIPSGAVIQQIATGYSHTCVVAAGQVYCWGVGGSGRLGNGGGVNKTTPTAVSQGDIPSGTVVRQIAAGETHTCAITSDDKAYCWGDNTSGQLGNGGTTNSLTPTAVLQGDMPSTTVRQIMTGYDHTCAIASDDQAYCWGEGGNGRLGNNATTDETSPSAVSQGDMPSGAIQQMTGGNAHTCAIASDGKAYCWGSRSWGKLGDGSSSGNELIPSAVSQGDMPSDTTISQITAGYNHTCAIASDTQAYCWGLGNTGRLGNGSSSGSQLTPSAVSQGDIVSGTILQITGGETHTCAIADGQAYCWGSNSSGGLGDNSTTSSLTPVAVRSLDTPLNSSSYRLYENADSITPSTPLADINGVPKLDSPGEAFRLRQGINNGKGFTAISAGANHTCAIASGKAYCWGDNSFGQLGNNSTTESHVPVAVDTSGVLSGKTVTAISAGTEHSCAIASGQAYCWGNNGSVANSGRLGNNSTTSSSVPVAVDTSGVLSGKTVTAISAGDLHTCAVASGQAYCWGDNGSGKLGNNAAWDQIVPVAVDTSGVLSGKTVTAVSAGKSHTCAVASGRAYCWGYNGNGRLGNNSTTSSSVPVAVDTSGVLTGKTATGISAGYDHTCAVASGQAYCWGVNLFGRLGNDSTADSLIPVAVDTSGVLSGKTVTAISAGDLHTCAVASGQAYCWGHNGFRQLGNGSATFSYSVPVLVDTSGILSSKTVTAISAGGDLTCAVASGQAYCWGNNSNGQLGDNSTTQVSVPVAVDTSGMLIVAVISSATNGYHTCAVASGQAYCWGEGGSGRLGNNSTTDSSVPVAVDTSGVLSGKTVTAVSAGKSHTCAVASGQAYCWGENNYGQLGNASTTDSLVPVAVDTSGVLSGKTVTAISAGSNYTCAVASGQAYCWGTNSSGRLGNDSTSSSLVPVAVDTSGVLSGKTVTAISAGNSHTCTIASDKVYCWGNNGDGKLGNNSTTNSSVPVTVDVWGGVLMLKTVTAVSVGTNHTCVAASDQAYCWGRNNYGQLGDGSTTQSSIPVAVDTSGVLSGKTVTAVSTGSDYTCAIASGQAYCWGNNSYGRLGDGSTTLRYTPVAVDTFGVLSGKTVTAVAAGYFHVCVIASDQAYCWGRNNNGQLGNNSLADSSAPVAVYTIADPLFLGSTILAGADAFILEYAALSAAACSGQTTGFTAVTSSTPIAYNTNSSVANGAAITTNSNDPTDTATTIGQTYQSSDGSFTTTSDIPTGSTGLFDFSLKDNGATANATYCLRIAYSDGSPIESATAYAEITMANGVLLIEIVDGSGNAVANPSFPMSATTVHTACQSATGVFGTSSQQLRIFNSLSSTGWSVNVAATAGPTASWSSSGSSYDFNDPSGSPPGCSSGSDGDTIAGRLSLNPVASTITPQSGCGTTGLSKGSLAGFSQGVTDAITLLAASSLTPTSCFYYITGVGVLQYIPASQPAGSYSIDVTTTVVAQ